ncbi:MAG TPA: glycosyltransferase family 2 protein [Steroidobacteraceae bacterium]|jgi:glycosyltransferase involved in cell wall biosynthesis|nr:glycosyltransferase family 2 protein [Steroidobacteraceae bacterium]
MTGISVLILTWQEEVNIAACVDSCAWSDDIVVFDSMSTDRTCEIARSKGARVLQRAFDNYAAQRSAALSGTDFRHPWVLMVDADERVPGDLRDEMERAVAAADPDVSAFRMRRKDFFMGRWLKRSSGYPTWFGRLVRPDQVRIERDFNEETIGLGRVERLSAHLQHFPFSKGISYWFERHNRYSSMEVVHARRLREGSVRPAALFSLEPLESRRALKRLAYRVPFRPVFVFLYLYVLRRGFLDGRAGLYFSCMRAMYESLIDLKTVESTRREHGRPI